jgi:serine/threonine-protein kinase
MGAVELCEEVGTGRLVARKSILPELLRDAKARGMFLREARLLSRIDHPNVVRMLEIDPGDDDVPPSLLMEFVDGVPLRDLLVASPEGLPVPIAARLARDVALGLHAAHELRDDAGTSLGVVHRDVSPHNVLVTFDGRVKLLDFGVAKTTEGTRTGTGEVKGKMAYMAPEQAMADPVDRRADVYALGALTWEMLTGQRMHGEGTDLEILRRIATQRPKPARDVRPSVPKELSELVARMTAEPPGERPPTAADVAAALEPFAAGADEPTVAGWLERTLPRAQRARRARVETAREAREITKIAASPGKSRVIAAVAVVAIAAAAGLAFALRPAPPPAPPSVEAPSRASATAAPSASAMVEVTPVDPASQPSARPIVRPRVSATVAAPPPAVVPSSPPVVVAPPPATSRTKDIPIDKRGFD